MTVDELFLSFQEAVAGQYSLEREIGRGGMGVVYLARDVRLDRPVAIKLLPPDLAMQATLRERFLREARMAARLSHPYIVPTHSVDEILGFVFYVMTYVDGETLAQRVAARGPMSAVDVTRVMREVAWALAYAHAQGVVHRDVKPANILLEKGTERAMVTDFGIARHVDSGGLTQAGELLGTPEYMSPEQGCGEPVDGRSDLYSLGVVGYYALTGAVPFSGSVSKVLAQHITKPAPPMASLARGTPRSLADAIDKCLAKSPKDRFATGEALADALAAGLAKRADLPVPLRVFTDRRRQAAIVAPVAMAASLGLGLIANRSMSGLVGLGVFGGVAVLPILITMNRLRELARHGYGPEDVAAALRSRYERQREEFLFEFGQTPSWRERLVIGGGRAVLYTGLVSVLIVASGELLGGPKVIPAWYAHFLGSYTGLLGALSVLGVYGGAISFVIGSRWRNLRMGKGPRMAKFWESRFGKWLGRSAALNIRNRAIPADRPTELKIAISAEALFQSLPKALRESLGDVPAVLRTLQERAHAVREQIDKFDAVLATSSGNSPGRADAQREALTSDVKAARKTAESRLSELVTALETVRLDLLRLQAGVGKPESITQDLAAAAAVGQDADRLIAALGEADAAMKRKA
jgi:hypothetical protein